MPYKDLKEMFRVALEVSRPLLQAASTPATPRHAAADAVVPPGLTDLQKLQFYGYFKQATKGDISDEEIRAPRTETVDIAKMEAWKKCRNLSRRDAMRAFVYLMFQVDPTWETGSGGRSMLETVPEVA